MRDESSRGVRVRAFAKINLALRVLGRRDDGYHELRTTFQSLALHDTLTFTPHPGPFEIEPDDPACPLDQTNLVWKAAEALWRRARRRGPPRGVHVRVRKRIPLQAGLGGGSSDAAAALRALCVLWDLPAGPETLVGIAAELGADVPYFLLGGTVLGLERGDLLFPLVDGPPASVVLVRPSFGVSTQDAFRWWDERQARGGWRLAGAREAANDLEPAVAEHHPEIGAILKTLRRAGAYAAAMSGSGSGVFGLFTAEAPARLAAGRVASPRRRTWQTRTIARASYLASSRPVACG